MCPLEEKSIKVLQEAAAFIKSAQNGTVLSGAGISTASGIPDFRSTGGLWKRFNPMEVASLSAFRYRPERFFQWLRMIALEIDTALPNPAHLALTELERLGHLQTVVTQNVDGLHQKAGFKTVLEVHGSLQTATCIRCFHKFDTQGLIQPLLDTGEIPLCPDCRGILKPDLILFEEQLPYFTWKKAQEACRASDLIIVIGSSLEVLPVAGLPMLAIEHGAPLIQINKTETYLDVRSDVIIRGDAAEVLPIIVSIIKDS